MKYRNFLAPVVLLSACALGGCALTMSDLGATANGHVWEMYATGNIAGADVARDLGFGSTSPQVELDGSVNLWRNRFGAEWAHIDRSSMGHPHGTFDFAGAQIPFTSNIQTTVKGDIVYGTYGFKIGPELLSVTPMLGPAYVQAKTTVVGTGTATIVGPIGVPVAVAFTENDHQPFPVGGLRIDSVPLDWLDITGQAVGFGIPQGYLADAQALVGFRFYHARADVGYRYMRFSAGDTQLQIKGLMFGGGLYF